MVRGAMMGKEFEALRGRRVIDLRARGADKGAAVLRWLERTEKGKMPLSEVFYAGDDTTDEDAFQALGPRAVTVAVGQRPRGRPVPHAGSGRAGQVASPAGTGATGKPMSQEAIECYGMIGDMRTAALISSSGGIDWCCLPRFDSASVFASLLDPARGGTWRIHPEEPGWRSTQSYLDGTNVLETQFELANGAQSS